MDTFNHTLKKICKNKNNRLCIGLDLDNERLEDSNIKYMENLIFEIIEGTISFCPIYKINFSFYEKLGAVGYNILKKIPEIIKGRAITIADAKRGDIGNSSKYYAESIFNYLNYDSVTISPYMGEDSMVPFLNYKDKGVFILCLTSNKGSNDFQKCLINNKELYKHVAEKALKLNVNQNIGLVVGATNFKEIDELKNISKDLPWLMPGVGTQGGDLKSSIEIEQKGGLSIINVSRDIIYHGDGKIGDIVKSAKIYTEKIRENI